MRLLFQGLNVNVCVLNGQVGHDLNLLLKNERGWLSQVDIAEMSLVFVKAQRL